MASSAVEITPTHHDERAKTDAPTTPSEGQSTLSALSAPAAVPTLETPVSPASPTTPFPALSGVPPPAGAPEANGNNGEGGATHEAQQAHATQDAQATPNSEASTYSEEEYYGEFEPNPKKGQGQPHNDDPSSQPGNNSFGYSITSGYSGYGDRNSLMGSAFLDQSLRGSAFGSWYFQPMPVGAAGGAGTGGGSRGPPGTIGSTGQAVGPDGQPLPPYLTYWLPDGRISELTSSGLISPPNANIANPTNPNHPSNPSNPNNPSKQTDPSQTHTKDQEEHEGEYKVYNTRWIMLLYMSLLNLLSDWTCYSVAPIAILTIQAFGDVDPESLVTVFLSANAVASACEPAILGRLGLRRTVLFGALLLMAGSIVKSGGVPFGFSGLMRGVSEEEMLEEEEKDETWRLYVGFFLVGLSQPLYQCTPALLSASWFPENERTMATGVALNSNQLGIGCAFVFGTLLVSTEQDIIPYFGLLSVVSTITFVGAALQFDDAPPTPPSDTARVIKGTLEIKIPNLFKAFGQSDENDDKDNKEEEMVKTGTTDKSEKTEKTSNTVKDSNASNLIVEAPAPAPTEEPTESAIATIDEVQDELEHGFDHEDFDEDDEFDGALVAAPSPASGDKPVRRKKKQRKPASAGSGEPSASPPSTQQNVQHLPPGYMHPLNAPMPGVPPGVPMMPHPYQQPMQPMQPMLMPPPGAYPYFMPPPYGYPGQPYPGPPGYQGQHGHPYPHDPSHPLLSGPKHTDHAPSFSHGFDSQGHYHNSLIEGNYEHFDEQFHFDEGVEPVLTQLGHNLDIDVRDDQIWLSFKACFARKGFAHCVVAFTTSGIIINTLSTFMDYLVTLNGARREYVGIVGGTFQLLIMAASLVFGGWTDHSRKYYFVVLAMLVCGAFALAVCNVNLDADAGGDLRVNLLIVAVLAGPLQPISTELGVEVVYPLSENTVLVIQQLFSNLLSALFIPLFKMLRDVGTETDPSRISQLIEVPQYTFSFYMLIIIHACSTLYFATFNGKYLRYEAELEKKRLKEEKERERNGGGGEREGLLSGEEEVYDSVLYN